MLKKSLFFLIFILFFSFNFVYLFADGSTIYDFNYIQNNLDQSKAIYNRNIGKVPNFVREIFGNEDILVSIIKLNGDTVILSIKTKKGLVTKFNSQIINSKYTLKAITTEETINNILSSKNYVSRFKEALSNDDISLKPLTFRTYIKLQILKTLLIFS